MKNAFFAVLIAVNTLLLGGCAGGPQRPMMVPVQQVQPVTPPQFLCNGRWQVGPCGSSQGTTIPIGQIMQAGSGIGKCELVGGAGGAVGGALIGGKDHRLLGAAIGLVAGAFAGNQLCESDVSQVQQVAVAQPQVVSKNDMTGIEKQHVPATGCGVRVQGYSLKEFPGQQGHSCETDRAEFTAKYMAQCHGKGGTLAKDVLCGRSL